MTRLRPLPLLVPLVLALAGCTQFAIRSDHDRTADFSRLRTYGWLPLGDVAPAVRQAADTDGPAAAVDAFFTALCPGLWADIDEPVKDRYRNNAAMLFAESTEQQGTASRSYLLGARWEGWSGIEPVYQDTYREGTLYLAVLDGRTKRMIWIGAASARILPHIPLEKRAKRVDAAVHQILDRFPPG